MIASIFFIRSPSFTLTAASPQARIRQLLSYAVARMLSVTFLCEAFDFFIDQLRTYLVAELRVRFACGGCVDTENLQPFEGSRVSSMGLGEAFDSLAKLPYRSWSSLGALHGAQDTKPAFHLIQPGQIGRRGMQEN